MKLSPGIFSFRRTQLFSCHPPFRGGAAKVLRKYWRSLFIAFPPCKYLGHLQTCVWVTGLFGSSHADRPPTETPTPILSCNSLPVTHPRACRWKNSHSRISWVAEADQRYCRLLRAGGTAYANASRFQQTPKHPAKGTNTLQPGQCLWGLPLFNVLENILSQLRITGHL